MFFSPDSIVHRELIDLQGTPQQIRGFIMTPERILDYYPSPIEGGILEAGRKIYCRGKSGVSLLEVVPEQSHELLFVIKVTTAIHLNPPFTEERIKALAFFTMYEDWQLQRMPGGTRLTKTWRDIEKHKMKYLPMRLIVRSGASKESNKLQVAWDKAADNSSR